VCVARMRGDDRGVMIMVRDDERVELVRGKRNAV
jgi:hypothetical protein